MTVSRVIHAPAQKIYEACLNPAVLAQWRAPDQMKGEIHSFEHKVKGRYRMSLTYLQDEDSGRGKSSAATDTFTGQFIELIPNKKIVEEIEFESAHKEFSGKMTMITRFAEIENGTLVSIEFTGMPAGIRPEDNEEGTRQSLQKLADLVESRA